MSKNQLQEDLVNKTCGDIWRIRYSLLGLGSLLENSGQDVALSESEHCGLGCLLKVLSKELKNTEESLYQGYVDSTKFEVLSDPEEN